MEDGKLNTIVAQLDDVLHAIQRLNEQVIALKRKLQGENPVRDVITCFDELWVHRYARGRTPVEHYQFNRRVDPAHVKRLLTLMDALALKARVTNYFLDRDPFLVKNRHPFNLFISGINKYGGALFTPDVRTPDECAAETDDWLHDIGYCFHEPKCDDSDVCRAKRVAEARP